MPLIPASLGIGLAMGIVDDGPSEKQTVSGDTQIVPHAGSCSCRSHESVRRNKNQFFQVPG
jgi:hypothetical protein